MEYQLYPKLNNRYILHINPTGGNIIPLPRIGNLGSCKYIRLNQASVDIIAQCNGRFDIKSLCLANLDIDISDISGLITLGLEEGFLDIFNQPQIGEIEIVGSKDFHSPNHFIIELTDRCNLSCLHCYRDSGSRLSNSLNIDKLTNILSQLYQGGIRSIEFTGGEPLMYYGFKDIIKKAAEYFNVIGILSNGWFLDEQLGEFLSDYKEKIFVQIDLDGPDAETHEDLRGRSGSFDKAVKAIEILAENNIFCRAAMNVYKRNFAYIQDVLLLSKSIGAKCFSSSLVMDIGRAKEIEPLSPFEISAYCELLHEFSEKYPYYYFPTVELMERLNKLPRGCGAGRNKLVLGPAGKVRFCVLMPESDVIIGDLTKTSYMGFLQQENLKIFQMLKPPDEEFCASCEHKSFCGNCIARPFELSRRFKARGIQFKCLWNEKHARLLTLP